jgi:hypothetical protein
MKDDTIRSHSHKAKQKPNKLSRRAVLKAGGASLPVILSLHSSSALAARSSNLVSAAPAGTRHPDTHKAICLDSSTLTPVGEKYDLGETGYAKFNMLSDHQYYTGPGQSDGPYTADQVCGIGGPFSYKDPGFKDINVPQGIIVSGGAYLSVTTNGLNTWASTDLS